MPVKAARNIYDTSGVYAQQVVNFGSGYENSFLPDIEIDFANNLIDTNELDTRNLILCCQLNLCESPILSLAT